MAIEDEEYFSYFNPEDKSAFDVVRILKRNLALTKQVRNTSRLSYNDDVPKYSDFGRSCVPIVEYWLNIFDNYPLDILLNVFQTQNEKTELHDIFSFFAVIAVCRSVYLILFELLKSDDIDMDFPVHHRYDPGVEMDRGDFLLLNILNILIEKQSILKSIGVSSKIIISDSTKAKTVQYMKIKQLHFKPEHFYVFLDQTCRSCDSIYSIISDCNDSKNTSSNLFYLHSILSDELFVKLMCKKSEELKVMFLP